MIEMCMGQDDRVQVVEGSLHRDAVVVFEPAPALKEPAVHEDFGFTGLDQIRRPRDLATASATYYDLHLVVLPGYVTAVC
jgi:hypothetical protein